MVGRPMVAKKMIERDSAWGRGKTLSNQFIPSGSSVQIALRTRRTEGYYFLGEDLAGAFLVLGDFLGRVAFFSLTLKAKRPVRPRK